jgi:hypothetical protein
MEDLWLIRRSGVDHKDLADLAEYHRFLDRFRSNEEDGHRRDLLYGDACLSNRKDRDEES